MSIEAFGLADTSNGAATSSIRILSGGSAPLDVYMRWHTMQATGVIKAFDLAVSVRRVLKSHGTSAGGAGGVSDTQYGDWSDWYYEQVPIAQCTPIADSTGYNYAHTLNLAGMYAKEGLSNNGFNFISRQNDEMHFQLKIKAIYEPTWANAWNDGVLASPVTYAEAWIGWIPQYSISSASFDMTGDVKVTFNRPYWLRVDDEWILTSFTNGGKNILAKRVSGTVGNGNIIIPRKSFTQNVSANTASHFVFTINAAYKSKGYALTSVSDTKSLTDLSHSSMPNVSVNLDGVGATVSVSSAATNPKSTTFDIKLRGYGDETDSFTGVAAGTYNIPFPPLDTPFYIDVRGHGINSQSVIVSCGPYTISSAKVGAVIQDVGNPSNSTRIFYGTVGKRSGSRDVNVVKLAGRSRSSAYFGTGASVSEMLQGKLIDLAGIERDAPEALEKLATTGKVVMVRKPGGYRHRCVITKFTAQRGCVSPVVDVQLSLTEVD
nr:MAG TPA_asm: hypothetical protein [Caudoviricetes sp.]